MLTIGDLIHTLAVNATIHQLDMTVSLPGVPATSSEGLTQVRRCLDGNAGPLGLLRHNLTHTVRGQLPAGH